MADISYPLINGFRHDWSSIEIKIDDKVEIALKEIKYNDSLKGTNMMGTHAKRMGRTRGVYECSASLSIALAEANKIRKALADKGQASGKGYKEVAFDIVCSYAEDGFDTIVDTITGCRITDDEGGGSQGADPMFVPWTLDPDEVFWDGLSSLGKRIEDMRVG